jgi:hypothetical protein
VIVAQQVQQTMQGQHPQLGPDRVPESTRLPPRHAEGDGDVA